MRARDSEESQSRSIEQQYRVPSLHDGRRAKKRDDSRDERHTQISPIVDRPGWNSPDENIPRDSAGVRRNKGEHQNTKHIQLVLDTRHRPAECKDESTGKIKQIWKRHHES